MEILNKNTMDGLLMVSQCNLFIYSIKELQKFPKFSADTRDYIAQVVHILNKKIG